MADPREPEEICAARCTTSAHTDDEYLGNTASPGTWEEDGDARGCDVPNRK
ncbi:hypothetical protein scyTo_0005691, partial [Scyliorhinus torazame]|nr:hypothetical protein [Scyliorhinus torazame]